MKKSCSFKVKSLPGTIVIALVGAAGLASNASAQVRTWTTTTPDGDIGNWSDTSKWSGADVPDTIGESAVFGAYTNDRTITVDGAAYAINKLTITPRTTAFLAKAFTLNSTGGSLLLGSGGLDIDNGNTVAVNVPIELTADQTWNALGNPAGSANFTGLLSGVGRITRAATGGSSSVFSFTNANTFSGGFVQQSANSPTTRVGSSSIVNSGAIESGPLGLGTITLNGGTLSVTDGTSRTLHNNVIVSGTVNLGRSGNAGALTFSDSNLTTPTTFTLGSTTNGSVTNLRLAANVTFDQVIAETGGSNQGVLFSSTSGTPTVTLNRAKTAGGPILVGGVNLVLASGVSTSGSMTAVGGGISATDSNKLLSGPLVVDGTNLTATDPSNFSNVTGGAATIFNNGRISFAVDQTQAAVASLLTSNSLVRLGIGSGALSITVAEDYNQSALGNGRAGLVSASTGTITYIGNLTAGSDSTYRIGGGLGTLAFASNLSGANALRVEGSGTVTTSLNQTYTGATILNGGITTLAGAAGAFSGTSNVAVVGGATLNVDSGNTGNNRIPDTAAISLTSGSLVFNNNTLTTAFSESAGDLSLNAGVNQINFRTTPAAATIRTVSLRNLNRSNSALLLVRGDSLGGTGTARNEIKFTNAPTTIGGGGAAGTNNQSIVPWMRGVFDGGLGSAPGRFATYEVNGLRTLNPGTEMVQANATTRVDQAIATNAGSTTLNMRWNPSSASGATLLNTAGATATVNSLWIGNSGSTAANTYGLNTGTINVTSGAVHLQHDATQNFTVSGGTLAFGSAEAVITSNSGGFLTTLSAGLSGSGGLSIYTLNGGGISLGGSNTFTGTFTFGGNGFIAVDQDTRFGNAANALVHAGGELRFFAGFASARAMSLLADVGNNTLANNNTSGQTVTLSGEISGAGRLRLINNNGSNGNNGFALNGANSYSGGTLIEGVNVSGSNNTSFGSGTVTLQGASTNAPGLSLTAAAPVLGGLRGTMGTVTISPVASSATLTIGSANENAIFAGNVAQGAGKTVSIEKVGTGTQILSGNIGYTGDTTVTAGTLSISQAALSDTSLVNLATGATLNLAYTGTDVVGEFRINGVTQAPGVYGAIGSGAQFTTARITGTGRIQSTVGLADPYLTWIGNFPSLTGADAEKTADPDKDGLSNFAEYALDGNPTVGVADGKSRTRIETVAGGQALILTLPVLDGAVFTSNPGPSAVATVGNTTYVIEGSNDLVNFNQGVTEITPSTAGLVIPNSGWTQRSFRLNGDIGGATPRGAKGFLRVKIISNP